MARRAPHLSGGGFYKLHAEEVGKMAGSVHGGRVPCGQRAGPGTLLRESGRPRGGGGGGVRGGAGGVDEQGRRT